MNEPAPQIDPDEDSWFNSPEGQRSLREALADLDAGRVNYYENDEAFLIALRAAGKTG